MPGEKGVLEREVRDELREYGEVSITGNLKLEDLAEQLMGIDDDAIVALFLRVDNLKADWDFTLKVHKEFQRQVEKGRREGEIP